jgi:hypothetical protein
MFSLVNVDLSNNGPFYTSRKYGRGGKYNEARVWSLFIDLSKLYRIKAFFRAELGLDSCWLIPHLPASEPDIKRT